MVTSDGSTPAQPRQSLRINANRQSMTGAGAAGSPKASGSALVRSSSTRVSSPGQLGAHISPSGSPMAAGNGTAMSPGFGPNSPGDLPRLPCVSESGEKTPRPPGSNPLLRRASTMMTMNVNRSGFEGHPSGSKETESVLTLKKERNALRMDKNVLLLNKRRLEGLVTRVLEGPLVGEDDLPGSVGSAPGSSAVFSNNGARASIVRASNLRAHLMQALDESIGLEKQLASTGGGGANMQPTTAFGDNSTESVVKALEAKIAQMQADHEVAMKHMESELAYRRTQATAANQGAQKQLAEALDDLKAMKRNVDSAETMAQDYYQKNADLKLQVQNLETRLADTNRELATTKEILGMDKTTMNTVINMLKAQLDEANTDRANKTQQIAELEYVIVQRETLLAEAHDRINQAAAQAAAAAAAGASSSAAVARIAAAMPTPLDSKNSWGHVRTSMNGGGGGGSGGGAGDSPLKSTISGAVALSPQDVKSGWGQKRQSMGGAGGGNSGGGGSLATHHSHRRIIPSRGSSTAASGGAGAGGGGGANGHLSDPESYSGERFEAEDM